MAVHAGKRRTHGPGTVRGIAEGGDSQSVAIEVGSIRQHATCWSSSIAFSLRIGCGVVGRDRRPVNVDLSKSRYRNWCRR